MAELVEVATALTSPCDDTLIGAGINSANAVAQSGRGPVGRVTAGCHWSDEACHCQTRSFLKRG